MHRKNFLLALPGMGLLARLWRPKGLASAPKRWWTYAVLWPAYACEGLKLGDVVTFTDGGTPPAKGRLTRIERDLLGDRWGCPEVALTFSLNRPVLCGDLLSVADGCPPPPTFKWHAQYTMRPHA